MFDLPTRSPDNGVLGLAMTFTPAAGGSPPEAISRRSPMVPERDTGDYRLHRDEGGARRGNQLAAGGEHRSGGPLGGAALLGGVQPLGELRRVQPLGKLRGVRVEPQTDLTAALCDERRESIRKGRRRTHKWHAPNSGREDPDCDAPGIGLA